MSSIGLTTSEGLRCTLCRSPLAPSRSTIDGGAALACTRCTQHFPVRWGIPDLRRPADHDPFLSREEDLRAAERLYERAEQGGFAAALAAYYAENPKVSAAQARRFTNGVLAAGDRAELTLQTWQTATPAARAREARRLVDVGCGTAPLAIAAARAGYETVGVDIGLRWLVLAAARAREAGCNIQFVCAAFEALPFADKSVAIVAGESILELAASPVDALREAARVLNAGGQLWLTTPNRWSAGPDPHIGLPLGGWLPDTMVARYAIARGMVPPKRRLVGARELRRLLGEQGFAVDRVIPPTIAEAQRRNASAPMKLMIDAYLLASAGTLGRQVLSLIGPTLVVTAHRRP